MNIINFFLETDLRLLQQARGLVDPKYAYIVQGIGELVVIYGAILLISLWIYGVYTKKNQFKEISLSIFYTILVVFVVYAIINLGIPKWRLGAMEAVKGITPLIPHPIDNSFPSGHALFTGALLIGLYRYFYKKSIFIFTIFIGFLTLSARVIGGVHYPGDIIGGLLIGSIGAFCIHFIVDFLVSKTAPIFIKIASWIKL